MKRAACSGCGQVHDDVLRRSDNPGEAANALAQAQRLMAKYRIDQCELDEDDEEIQVWTDEPLDEGAHVPPWKQAIGGAIAEVNDCVCLVSDRAVGRANRRIMVIAGRRSDYEACALMYRWITSEIDRMAVDSNRRVAAGRHRMGLGRRWLNSFRHGAAAEVEDRLYQEVREQRQKLQPETTTALDIRRDAVHQWAEENLQLKGPRGRVDPVDAEAFELGSMFGRFMPLREREHGEK